MRHNGALPDTTGSADRNEGLSGPDWNDVERGKLMQAMRKAGFPACASADVLAKLAKPFRLPECARPQPTG